ncbi:exodeoxyribonuclease VII large subunit [Candidatus Parabeggiatoa sp. HSG14]|uniref:exodeoxyribonuclease VII large subunit n=1 Tax=Candidatus Parabeggiatoa sp. HSG14 TaxID=3055593 RepID=UPI0025A73AC1|nr:exodeoxyribonuclease VII large subunit [Thiotrichales bacterium HSG14]
MITEEPIFLDCPFSEKEEAKRLGAKFDWDRKKWFIPPGVEKEAFAKWLPKTVTQTPEDIDEGSITLNNLLLSVQNTIAKQHNDRYWVRAEVVNVSDNVHLYIDLADHDDDGNEIAKARATLWNHRVDVLLGRFEEQTNMPFKAGIKVLLQVRVEFHTRYGFSLNILDIDPRFTLGEMEAKLNRIRATLKQEGIYSQNQLLVKPKEFCQVAVISPPQAAGLGDFKSQADILAALKLCEFCYYPASFQGQNAMTDIVSAFESINQDHKKKLFDAVVMIRGGGAKTDLFQLNEYEIAKAVCTAQLPVIVGIGHERDKTLLDEIANHTCHTPSLVIAHIASTIIENARNAKQNWQSFITSVGENLNQAKVNNEQLNAQIREQAVKCLGVQQQKLATLMQTLKNASQNQLHQAQHQIKFLMEQVLLGDPKVILNRGYAIVRNNQNKIITTKVAAKKENSLQLEFKDGRMVCQFKKEET